MWLENASRADPNNHTELWDMCRLAAAVEQYKAGCQNHDLWIIAQNITNQYTNHNSDRFF